MANFIYQASNSEGKTIKGEISARDRKEALSIIINKGFTPIFLKEKTKKRKFFSKSFSFKRGVSLLDKVDFTNRLSALLRAGIPITRSLEILAEGAERKELKDIYNSLKNNIESGRPFWQSLSDYKEYFSPVFIGLVKSGEESGNLENVLSDLARELLKTYNFKQRVRSATFYPLILSVFAVFVVIFLLVFVIPKIVGAYSQAGIKLPMITLILIKITKWINMYYPYLILVFLILSISFYLFKRTKKGTLILDKMSLSLPIFGDLYKKVNLADFSRNLSMLLNAGVTIEKSLRVTSTALSNTFYQKIVLESKNIVQKGVNLSICLDNYPHYFPKMLTGSISVGEESGNLAEMLQTLGDFYSQEVDRKLSRLADALTPILLVILGIVVALIGLSVLVPIYTYVTSF